MKRSMRRSFQITLARQVARSRPPLHSMTVVRLDRVLLPDMSILVRQDELPPAGTGPLAAIYPGTTVGVEIDATLAVATSSSDSMLVCGGTRVRLLRERPSHDRTHMTGVLHRVVDVPITPARAAKLSDEAMRAHELRVRVAELEAGANIDTLRAWDVLKPSALSLALAARLPLTPSVLTRLLESTCPLGRLQGVVDAMRLLVEPLPRRWREGHQLVVREDHEGRVCIDRNQGVV